MKFKKVTLTIISLILISIISCSQSRKSLWEKDINYLKTELAQKHKNLFFKISREVFNNKLDSINKNIDNLTDVEIYIALQEVIAYMGDDHTSLYSNSLKDKGFLPIYLYWFSDGLYVLRTFNQYSELLGKKITAINNVPIKEITHKLSKLTGNTNNAIIKKNVPNLVPIVSYLQYYKIIDGDIANISFESQPGIIKQISVKSTKDNNFWSKMVSFKPEKEPLCNTKTKRLFWYHYDEKQHILYAQYNKCLGKEVELLYGNKKKADNLPSFNKFSSELIKMLESRPVEKFIFDMRYNSGGSSPQGTELVNKIAGIKSINKKGKLFVIVGRNTFSSAILNTLDFQNNTNSIFVGEATGGRPNHYGEVKRFLLPNHGLTVNYSTNYFTYSKNNTNSFYPDFEITTSFNDYKNGIDPVYEWILKYK